MTASQLVNIDRIRGDSTTSESDPVAVEEPLEIQLVAGTARHSAAKSISVTMRTPGHDIDLALGFLVSESIIHDRHDVAQATSVGAKSDDGLTNTVRVELRPDVPVDLKRLERHFYTTSSCGVCGKASLEAVAVAMPPLAETPWHLSRRHLIELPDKLYARQAVFRETGGLHGAAVFNTDGDLSRIREDVGRHNAVDKVIGSLFRDDALPGATLGLLVSGRASFELVQKALVAGMRALVSVSAPSSLAVRLAREFDLTLVGFLRRDAYNVYSGKHRLVD